jgi:hypothetical protein
MRRVFMNLMLYFVISIVIKVAGGLPSISVVMGENVTASVADLPF